MHGHDTDAWLVFLRYVLSCMRCVCIFSVLACGWICACVECCIRREGHHRLCTWTISYFVEHLQKTARYRAFLNHPMVISGSMFAVNRDPRVIEAVSMLVLFIFMMFIYETKLDLDETSLTTTKKQYDSKCLSCAQVQSWRQCTRHWKLPLLVCHDVPSMDNELYGRRWNFLRVADYPLCQREICDAIPRSTSYLSETEYASTHRYLQVNCSRTLRMHKTQATCRPCSYLVHFFSPIDTQTLVNTTCVGAHDVTNVVGGEWLSLSIAWAVPQWCVGDHRAHIESSEIKPSKTSSCLSIYPTSTKYILWSNCNQGLVKRRI